MGRHAVSLVLLACLLPGAVLARTVPDCSTPRRAARTFVDNLADPEAPDEYALECFEWATARVPRRQRLERARQLLDVLDARGLLVVYDTIPDAAEIETDRVYLFDEHVLADVWLEKRSKGWVVPADAIVRIPGLYAETFAVDIQRYLHLLPPWMRSEAGFGVHWWQLVGLFLLLVLAWMFRRAVSWILTGQFRRLLRGQGDDADRRLLARAALPIGTLVMAGVIGWLLPLLRFSVRINQVAIVAVKVLAAASAVMLVYRLVDVVSDVFSKRASKTHTKLDDQLIPLIRKTAKVVVAVVGGIFVLQNLHVDVASLLAGATVGGLAFSFAAKDTVANLFGSISVFTDQPFQIGDWVVIEGKEGTVLEVGLRSTRIRTFYDSVVTVPNSTVANAVVDNYGARRKRRCSITVGVTYDASPEQIEAFCDGIRAILRANPRVAKDSYEVHMKGFGASSIDVMLYFFLDVDSWSEELRQRHNVFLEILRLAKDLGVELAFPTQTVHVASLATATEAAPPRVVDGGSLGEIASGYGPGGARATAEGLQLTNGYYPGPEK